VKHIAFNHARATRTSLLAQEETLSQATTRDIRKVIVILSSSRSGSSLLYDLLKRTKQVLSLQGEHTVLYKLHGYSFPALQLTSDYIAPSSQYDLTSISRDILAEIGIGADVEQFAVEDHIRDMALRLTLQWPWFLLSAEDWLGYLKEATQRLARADQQWTPDHLLLTLCTQLRADGYAINPYYYDLPKELIKGFLGEQTPSFPSPQGPPCSEYCIEEPPFVVVRPRQHATIEDLQNKPLLLKASVDAYRFLFLRQLFPHAQFNIIHLTRNPASSINGLYDGWHDRGFFSYNLQEHARLAIAGYSDRYDWGTRWWNYDLPPQWESVIDQPLEYVCAFQWYSAHTHILDTLNSQSEANTYRIKFEDILHSVQRRQETVKVLLRSLNLDFDSDLQAATTQMPVVMATIAPAQRRWEMRKQQIWPIVTQPSISDLARELGYYLQSERDWL